MSGIKQMKIIIYFMELFLKPIKHSRHSREVLYKKQNKQVKNIYTHVYLHPSSPIRP